MFQMSAFSVDTGRQTTTPLVDGVVHNKLVHRPTNNDTFITSSATHSLSTFFPVSAVQKLLKSVKIWQSGSQMYIATFYKPRQKVGFDFPR